ncbi:EAL domain-containing protein [Vibrio sp. Of7-15]|uniref:bifunctional diguanylate cyclase/phosphodiesterase n=1 Tax=Vibrio sp. Of7-15 TaxID=2724879 RepID=UPI001EF2F1F7|nr:EAL domain-containing protein [Vibrio sp. Of7-15]MCG7498887.1 EAL domain-containing protein [Vibrio sp. Of7-15]
MQTVATTVSDVGQLIHWCQQFQCQRNEQILIQVFSTQSQEQVKQYYHIMTDFWPNSTMIGQSASSTFIQANVSNSGTLISVSFFQSTQLNSALVPISEQKEATGFLLCEQLKVSRCTKAIICLADGVTAADYPLFNAFSQLPYFIPIAGGAAGKGESESWIMLNGEFGEQCMVAVALESDCLQVWYDAFVEWHPVGKRFRVTKGHGNVIESIDNEPAYDVYCKYLANGKSLSFHQVQAFPLMTSENKGQGVVGVEKILGNGALELAVEIPVGDEVRFCYSHPSLTQEQVQYGVEQLVDHHPESIFIYNCESRRDFEHGDSELKPFAEVAPTQGVYCMAELFRHPDRQRVLHHSLTYLALRESTQVDSHHKVTVQNHQHALTPLFSLIRNSLADLDAMTMQMEKKLSVQAEKLVESYRVDRRTGLLNRVVLKERLAHLTGSEHLLTVKLTNLSVINDKYGYQTGDRLLRDLSMYFSEHLISQFNQTTELYSVGIGEWAVVFRSDLSSDELKQHFLVFTDQLEQVNFEPYGLPDIDHLSVAISGGLLSKRDFHCTSPDDMILKAIEARRVAMNRNCHLCDARDVIEEEQKRHSQMRWLTCANRAVLQQGVVVYVQPIVNAHDHSLASYECLMRIAEDNHVYAPGLFLPAVEGTHLYTGLSRQMIQRSFELMKDRNESFSINLSPQDLMNDRTLDLLEQSLSTLDDPSRVGLEVLETEQIQDYGRMIEVCDHFRRFGARIIVDDFGSGYSNIDEIVKLEPQIIKLDGSLIKNIDKDRRQRLIAQQMVQLCKVLEVKTVAEFVHNQEVCAIAKDIGVDYLQGYYLGEPRLLS